MVEAPSLLSILSDTSHTFECRAATTKWKNSDAGRTVTCYKKRLYFSFSVCCLACPWLFHSLDKTLNDTQPKSSNGVKNLSWRQTSLPIADSALCTAKRTQKTGSFLTESAKSQPTFKASFSFDTAEKHPYASHLAKLSELSIFKRCVIKWFSFCFLRQFLPTPAHVFKQWWSENESSEKNCYTQLFE